MLHSKDLTDIVCKEEKGLIRKAGDLIYSFLDNAKNTRFDRISYNCHSICRAISMEITDGSIKLVDGKYVTIYMSEDEKLKTTQMDHSWFLTKWGNILDPYPIGLMSIGPVIVANKGFLGNFTGSHYMESNEVTRRIATRDVWRKASVIRSLFARKEAAA